MPPEHLRCWVVRRSTETKRETVGANSSFVTCFHGKPSRSGWGVRGRARRLPWKREEPKEAEVDKPRRSRAKHCSLTAVPPQALRQATLQITTSCSRARSRLAPRSFTCAQVIKRRARPSGAPSPPAPAGTAGSPARGSIPRGGEGKGDEAPGDAAGSKHAPGLPRPRCALPGAKPPAPGSPWSPPPEPPRGRSLSQWRWRYLWLSCR